MDKLKHQLVKPAYRLATGEVLSQLGSNLGGLPNFEANSRLEQYGHNELVRIKRQSALSKYLRQYKDLMIVLLIISVGIALFLNDTRTAIIIGSIIIINTLIGFWQEFKADNIMASLEKLVIPVAKVKRAGKLIEIPSSQLVPGDILYIAEGDSVPADARVIEENELSTNDFALTGESNPSRKFTHPLEADAPLPARQNLVFMGTTVATGDATVVVIGTGMHTELGRGNKKSC